jgi:hypothetical protein
MLDQETIDYLINYYGRFFNEKERQAMTHQTTMYKLQHYVRIKKNATMEDLPEFLRKDAGLSTDPAVLVLLENGIEHFHARTAERMLQDHYDQIYFNNCPKCQKLARTHYAQQCRYCGYTWHTASAAKFRMLSCYQGNDKPFYILGEITEGEIKAGMKADLTWIKLAVKPEIAAVESGLYLEYTGSRTSSALILTDLSEEDKAYLRTMKGIINILK